jgi:hypothetical protein
MVMTALGLENRVANYTNNFLASNSYKTDFGSKPLYSQTSQRLAQPDLTFSYEGDTVIIQPNPCRGNMEYMVMREPANVDKPLTLDTGFYQKHRTTLSSLDTAVHSIQRIRDEMVDYAASGKLESLTQFVKENGYNTSQLKLPDVYAVTSMEGAVAFTIANKYLTQQNVLILGSGLDFDKGVKSLAKDNGIPLEIMIEFALTEELMHQVQPGWLHDLHAEMGYVALLEGHVKALQSLYFFRKAQGDALNSEHYNNLSTGLNNWYRDLIRFHVEVMGIPISKEKLEQLLDSESPDKVVKNLSKGAKRRADPCNDGYTSSKVAALSEKLSDYVGESEESESEEEESSEE